MSAHVVAPLIDCQFVRQWEGPLGDSVIGWKGA